MDLFLTFLGTSASVPTAARGTSAALIARGGARWLVDCGEGTQRQLLRSGLGLVDLDLVLVTHLHGDHYLGLPGLLKTYGLRGRERPLRIVGPPGLAGLVDRLGVVFGALPFPLELVETGPGVRIPLPQRMYFTVNALRGRYLIDSTARRATFNDIRVGLWFSFTR